MRLPYDRLGDVTLKGKIVIFIERSLKVQKIDLLAEIFEIGDVSGVRRIALAVRQTTRRMNQTCVQLWGHSVKFGEHRLIRRTNSEIR